MRDFLKGEYEIPSLLNGIYLDSAGAGLPPRSVTKAMMDFLEDWSKNGENWHLWLKQVVELRREVASLIGAKAEEIAIVPSVSYGIASLASSLRYDKKKVVISELNFPTNIVLWQRMKEAGLIKECTVLRQNEGRVEIEEWEKNIDENTLVVAVDYVSWLSGYREKIKEIVEIAHSKGAKVIVDGFHAVGVFPLDVRKLGIDALTCGFYKWLCGPHGTAFLYASEEFLKESEPAYIGWHGIEENVIERLQSGIDPFDNPFPLERARPAKDASRYEWGTWSAITVTGSIEAVKFAKKFSPESRFRQISKLRELLLNGLEEQGFELLTPRSDEGSGIVTFKAENRRIVEELEKKKIKVSWRFGYVRVSPHFYNTEEEIEEFLQALKQINLK